MLRVVRYARPTLTLLHHSHARASSHARNPYSETMNLLQSPFPMRASAATRELDTLDTTTHKLYAWASSSSSGETFVLHDGPPFANGQLHMGHALNKVLKDILNRHAILSQKAVSYTPGWDTHGLPIELKALDAARKASARELKKVKKKLKRAEDGSPEQAELLAQKAAIQESVASSPSAVRKLAASFAADAAQGQKEALIRWGIMGDYDNAYYTNNPKYEAAQLRLWGSLFQKSLFHRRLKPVYWSPSSQTALAEAELEYKQDHVSTAVYVAFPVPPTPSAPLPPPLASALDAHSITSVSALAWTTTPWTLVANKALTFSPDLPYALVRDPRDPDGAALLVAASEIPRLEAESVLPPSSEVLVSDLRGEDLVGLPFAHPLLPENRSLGLLGSHVVEGTGTGIVHTAPGHGQEDYAVVESTGVLDTEDPLFCPVDNRGRYTSALEGTALADLVGLPVLEEGTKRVVDALEASDALLSSSPFTHAYPYDWRTAKPIIFRATMQWFMDLSALKNSALDALDSVAFVPSEGKKRLAGMIGTRDEWCISRQRVWGVPIPVFYHKETDDVLATPETIDHVASVVSQHGTDAWFDFDVASLLPPSMAGQAEEYVKSMDTMDVWFDSGSSWHAVLGAGQKRESHAPVQADVYLEGSDQHRGWFQSSLLTSVALQSPPVAPYRTLITNGFVLDEAGAKMAKSLGNVMDPDEVIHGGNNAKTHPPYGADVMRIWVAGQEYTRDVRLGPQSLSSAADAYRKLRNTAKFLLANTSDADPGALAGGSHPDLSPLDDLVLSALHEVNTRVTTSFDRFQPYSALSALTTFVNSFLSTVYMDGVKDTLYAESPDAPSRRAVQYVLHRALRVLTASIGPIAPFLAEEIASFDLTLPGEESHFSAFQSPYPDTTAYSCSILDASVRPAFLELRALVNQQLEALRQAKDIGSGLEAHVDLRAIASEDAAAWLCRMDDRTLANAFGVSSVSLDLDPTRSPNQVSVSIASGSKCARCWKVTTAHTGQDLCLRCSQVLS